ncbi:MAG TPA: phosphoketolase [Candidatus Saccharimonadia bacterium]|jgi:xylulose-5-phosphate/fructose-6-phosphate phosphoketolase|nr:phosphoketolase [Candidatus Saccharimonadia bacterium]
MNTSITATELENIRKYVRAANYLSVTQIYLQDNFLLDRPLRSADIKPKLFGHWGTCPGINYVYAHANAVVKRHKQSAVFVLGPGHGMPGLQANLFIEGTLEKYYPKATNDEAGVGYVSKMFAWPYGFSSHCSPETPGLILEGGELGYSLASAYGAVLDNPELLAVCLIGDGEAETGATAAAWHSNKLVDPATNGAVLPILHLNGYKISGPTIYGAMSDDELTSLFTGYGYEPFIVTADEEGKVMADVMETCYQRIEGIQKRARAGEEFAPRWPMVIMRSLKGWTTIKELRGQKIEGTIAAHQVVMPTVRTDDEELALLEDWLRSYKFDELFDAKTGFAPEVLSVVPDQSLLMGNNPHMFGHAYKPLEQPKATSLAKAMTRPGLIQSNAMRMAGVYLNELFALNAATKNLRLMSPDETYSNRLDDVFKTTARGFVWPHNPEDKDITRDGRVMEMLSEHTMHGLAQGYVLTGRHAVFTTYEAFAQIFSSMAHMYQKFLKWVRKMPWRMDIPSMNYLLTSTAWRQEHNGYSHQNPSFVSGMLEKHNDFIKAYYPVDDNSMLAIMEEAMASKNQMNIITAGKTPEPRWLTYDQAKEALVDGLSTWEFASDKNPHLVVVGIGDYVTKEALAAIEIIKRDAPQIRVRFVNMLRLSAAPALGEDGSQIPNAEKYFTVDKPVIVTFHGYPETVKSMLFNVKNPGRFSVHGYQEEGGTTTPFDMQVRNHTDRYHLAIEMLRTAEREEAIDEATAQKLTTKYEQALSEHHDYITRVGADPAELENWQWSAAAPVIADVVDSHKLLKDARTLAFIGLSDDPTRHSYRVADYFKRKGYRVIPINPNVTETLGEKAYASLMDIPDSIHIDIVDIFRKPTEVVPHLQEIMDRGNIRTVWLAEGANSRDAEEFAEDYGLTMVTNQCIMEVDAGTLHQHDE